MEHPIKTKHPKKAIHKKIRYLGFALGILLLIFGSVATFLCSKATEQETSTVICAYQLSADAEYRVHLLPNTLYSEEWMEENKIYSEKLTDFVEITYHSDVTASNPVNISGEYTITSVLEGYMEKGGIRKIIFQDKKQLHTEKAQKNDVYDMKFSKTVKVNPASQKEYAANAEKILGGDTNRDFYILLEGHLLIGEEKQDFSHKISIPVTNREIYFDITKPEKIIQEGEISEKKTIMVSPDLQVYLPYLVLALIGCLLTSLLYFFTEELQGEQLRMANLSNTLRKFENHMVCVDTLPSAEQRTSLLLNDIHTLMALAEELRKPVIFCKDDNGLPKDGRFYIFDTEFVYLVEK